MILSNKIIVKSKYKGKSKFNFWKELEIRDVLIVSLEIKPVDRNGNGLYATKIEVDNCSNNSKFAASLTEMSKYLSNFEFEQV